MIADKVHQLLIKHGKSKDDDRELLLAWIYYQEGLSLEEKDAFNVLKDVLRRMPSLETLSRCRRKLQEENPDLRGNNYYKRQDREAKIRKIYSKI